jgi:hypothetical protein
MPWRAKAGVPSKVGCWGGKPDPIKCLLGWKVASAWLRVLLAHGQNILAKQALWKAGDV